MRIFLIASLAIVMCACGHQAAGTAGPLTLVNADFEQPLVDGNIPGWPFTHHAGVVGYAVSLDTSSPAQGKASAKMTRVEPQVYGTISQVLPLKGYDGKTIRVTAKMKSEGVGEKGWKLFLSARGQRRNVYSEPMTGTTPWKDVAIEVKVTPEVDQLTIGATLQDAGTGWIDDVQVRVVD